MDHDFGMLRVSALAKLVVAGGYGVAIGVLVGLGQPGIPAAEEHLDLLIAEAVGFL
jgi:hypothetical protein